MGFVSKVSASIHVLSDTDLLRKVPPLHNYAALTLGQENTGLAQCCLTETVSEQRSLESA